MCATFSHGHIRLAFFSGCCESDRNGTNGLPVLLRSAVCTRCTHNLKQRKIIQTHSKASKTIKTNSGASKTNQYLARPFKTVHSKQFKTMPTKSVNFRRHAGQPLALGSVRLELHASSAWSDSVRFGLRACVLTLDSRGALADSRGALAVVMSQPL